MNRETKRMLQRQGEVDAEGAPIAKRQPRQQPRPTSERAGPRQFAHEVRGELRKVAWPSRAEVINYSLVVLMTLVVVTAFIAGIDFLFAKGVLFLFD